MTIELFSVIIFIASFFATNFLIHKIRSIVIFKQLMDHPNKRSSHKKAVPNLGGISFYIVLLLSFYFIENYDIYKIMIALLPGIIILFFAGIKDDLVVLSPSTKLLAQILSAIFVVSHSSFRLNFHGFLGIEFMPIWLSLFLSVLIIVTVINIINLIDGIDGLASIVSIIIFATYSLFFYYIGLNFMYSIGIIMIACLLAFLRFNFSIKHKIFMGDTGSMLLGFMIGVFTVQFLSLNHSQLDELPFHIENIPLIAIFILIIPLFDTGRVFMVRILNSRSPFSADRLHIHHLLIDYYHISHKKASFYIGVFHLLFVVFFLFLSFFVSQFVLIMFFILMLVALSIFFYRIYKPNFFKNVKKK